MMKKSRLILSVLALGAMALFSSCKKDEKDEKKDDNKPVEATEIGGEVEGVLEKGEYIVKGDLIVKEGKLLTLKPGVILAFDANGRDKVPQLTLEGDLIAEGTAAEPIYITVVEDMRKPENAYDGVWGGIQATSTSTALILRHTVVEYTGAAAVEQTDRYNAGDPRYAILFRNAEGVFIFDHSTLRHIADDGLRTHGGAKFAIIHSKFYNVGETGGEGFNIKNGTRGVVAYNLFYSVATNGSKPAGGGNATLPQSVVHNYNNTFINCGHRRVQAGRGGSINWEDGATGFDYNNLIVNCRFGIRHRFDDLPDQENPPLYDYTHYYANNATDEDNFFPSTDLDNNGNRITKQQPNDIIQQDPMFVNYDVSTSRMNNILKDEYDFHLKPNAPGVGKGKTDFTPLYSTLGAHGVTVTIPGPSNFIGAFGTK